MKKSKLKALITGLSLAIGFTLVNPCSSYASWKQDSYGWWNTEGNSYSTGWRNIDNIWYNFGTDGYMKTGWINDGGTWYYLDNSGAMKTGWVNPGGVWYYLDQSGAMKTGWIQHNGAWYYTNQNGAMQTGFLPLGDNTYYLNESGAMVTGDITLNGVKYTFAQTGEKVSAEQTTGAAVNSVQAQDNTSSSESSNSDSSSSSHSGGGSGSSSSSNSNTSSSADNSDNLEKYSDLYGTWKVGSHIDNSGMKDSSAALSAFVEDKEVTVGKDGISSKFGSATNVNTSEKVLTNSEFKEKYGTDISKIGLSGDKVNCITITADGKQADIIVSSDNKVVAISDNTPFKLEKK